MTSAVAQKLATETRLQRRPSTLLRWFFRLPVALYRLGLAGQLGRSTLLLTTRGRKSGRRRTTALNYLPQGEGDVVYVVSGMGTRSDWLLNLQAEPSVHVQVGQQHFEARAEVITDPTEHRRVLDLWAERSLRGAPPRSAQTLMRFIGFDYEASVRRHLEEDPPPPTVGLYPCLT
jgi:deazaflavin-dependent oxidoreductase (nitroreductase family)